MRLAWITLGLGLATAATHAETLELPAETGRWAESVVDGVGTDEESFSVDVMIDPVAAEGGDLQVVSGLLVGVADAAMGTSEPESVLKVDLREGAGYAGFALWHRKTLLSKQIPNPKPPGWSGPDPTYQHPNDLAPRDGRGHRIRLVVWPEGAGSRVRLFVDFNDRPVEEHVLEERIRSGVVKLFTMRGGQDAGVVRKTRFASTSLRKIDPAQAANLPPMWESVLGAVNYNHPDMQPIAHAIQRRQMDEAKDLFLRHMRTRQKPVGPTLEEVESTALNPAWKTIADEVLAGRYGTVGYFTQFAAEWTDTTGETHRWVEQEEPLQVNWARCNGHLNRHFHWVSLAKAWDATHQSKYAQRFGQEVHDWVSREPFFWDRCPSVGGINLMDGTTFKWGYMNTSNIGRRLELTWWPAYEVFRKSSDFSDEAHFAMLLGMLRQARLIMNPSSFAAHDDGGAHTTMALLQTALMLPEFKESAEWRETAIRRWDEMLAQQFHPDGTHTSLSTGYSWASIVALENYLRLVERFGAEPNDKYLAILEKAFEHPMLLSTPNQSQIDLNDGGWGLVDDGFARAFEWFPHRADFQWMATKGKEGSPPEKTSVYFPNAGQYFMRTGWGEGEKYLFFGAGPWGASHGKQDALNLYAQFGNHLLIRNAGRGSYSGVGNTKHAGRSLSFNTLSPDWAQENSIPHWKQEMHRGHNPPKRRWISDAHFDYGEGAFEYGWHRPGEHIQGKWVRQVIFVKGKHAQKDGYYVVIDTVQPKDDTERTWRHPWHLNLNPPDISTRDSDHSVTAISAAVALQVLPVDPEGDLEVQRIEGQEEPELLGWRIHDTIAKPYPVPMHVWKASGTFSRAWIIQMQGSEAEWPVTSIGDVVSEAPGELRFTVQKRDGSSDQIHRRFPTAGQPDVTVITPHATLELTNGIETVSKPSLASRPTPASQMAAKP